MIQKLYMLIDQYERDLDFYKARSERLLKEHDKVGYIHCSAKVSLIENVLEDLKALQ